MGPRSEGARKAAPWRPCRGRGARFNGAALGGSAESLLLTVSYCQHYYMLQWGRARRERGKKPSGRRPAARYCMLQWGRARRERGKNLLSRYNVGDYLALQWGRARRERGKPARSSCSAGCRCRFNGAALGGSAERCTAAWTRTRCRLASMGPRSEGARKVTAAQAQGTTLQALQWGRARRERGKGTAERPALLLRLASMGPRSEGARKDALLATGWIGASCFNGAALGGSAERDPERRYRATEEHASMGPRSEGARKEGTVTTTGYDTVGFNGAALGGSAERANDATIGAATRSGKRFERALPAHGEDPPGTSDGAAVTR